MYIAANENVSVPGFETLSTAAEDTLLCTLCHFRLWSFKTRDTKLERFLHKNQHTQRKLLNFENWTNGEPQ